MKNLANMKRKKRVGSSRQERNDGRGEPKKRPTRAGKSIGSSCARRELQQDQHGDNASGSGDEGNRWLPEQTTGGSSPPTRTVVVRVTIATENQMGQIVRLRKNRRGASMRGE